MSNRGMFRVDWQIWEELGRSHGFNVHSMLLLPDPYQIVEVTEQKISSTECVMNVYVESDLIPDTLGIAELKPIYRREDEETFFDHMEIMGDKVWERLPQGNGGQQ
jgi:hypothetical protein